MSRVPVRSIARASVVSLFLLLAVVVMRASVPGGTAEDTGFSADRLFRFLNALGQDVEIVVRPQRRGKDPAGTRVVTWSEGSLTTSEKK